MGEWKKRLQKKTSMRRKIVRLAAALASSQQGSSQLFDAHDRIDSFEVLLHVPFQYSSLDFVISSKTLAVAGENFCYVDI